MPTPNAFRPAISYAAVVSLIISGLPASPLAYSEAPPEIFSPVLTPESLKPFVPGQEESLEKTEELLSEHEVFFESSPLSEARAVLMITSLLTEAPKPPRVEVRGYSSLGKASPLVGYVTLVPGDRNHFSYRYDIGASAGAAADVLLTREASPLDLAAGFKIGLRRQNKVSTSEGLETLQLIFIDSDGTQIAKTVLLTETEVTHDLDLTGAGFDASKVSKVILRQTFTDLERSQVPNDRRGEIFVSLEDMPGGAATGIPIGGQPITADYEAGVPTGPEMQSEGYNLGQGTMPGYIRGFDAAEGFHFKYDVGASAGSAVKAIIVPEGGPYIPASGTKLALALKNTQGGNVLVRLTDEAGKTAEYTLDLTASTQLFLLELQDSFYHNGAFDGQKIKKMEVVLDRALSPERRGEIQLRFLREHVNEFLLVKPVIASSSVNSAAQAVISFNLVPGAVIYQLQAASDQAFTNIVHEGFPSQSPERISFQAGGNYYFRLRASANAQLETGPVTQWSDTLTRNVPANTFTQAKPVINSVAPADANNAQVQFTTLTDAAIYEVQVSADPNFASLLHSGFPGQGTEVFPLPAVDVFYVRVRASIQQDVNLGPVSQWSDVFTYDKRALFSQLKPAVSGVEPDFFEGEAAINFAGVAGANYYEYQVSPNQQFNPLAAQAAVNSSPALADLEPGNYFVRVRGARDETGIPDTFSQWSNAFAFTIPVPETSISSNAQEQDLKLLPLGTLGPVQVTSLGMIDEVAFNSAEATGRGAEIEYNTGTTGWQGGGFRFDDFSTPSLKESADLRQLQHLVFGISGSPGEVKLEVIDSAGKSDFVKISGITAAEKFWRIPLSEFQGIDFSKISFIYFIVEGNGKAGVLNVNHLPAGLPIGHSAALTVNDLPNYPSGTAGPLRGAPVGPVGNASVVAVSERGIIFDYSTGTAGWAGGGLSYDNFGSQTVETGNLTPLSRLVFGLKGAAPEVTVEISDLQGRKVSFKILGIEPGQEKYWQIPVSLLDAVDLGSITLILFLVEGQNRQGRLAINYLKEPQIILPSETLAPADLLPLPSGEIGAPVQVSIGPQGSVNLAAATPRGVQVQYGTGDPGWAGGGLSYDNFSTQGLEKADLSSSQALTFGIKGTSDTLKFELIDTDGGKFTIPIKNISSTEEKVFRIPVSLIKGVNLAKIRLMYFIVEGAGKSGTFEVNHIAPAFELLPSAFLTPSSIVDFTTQGTAGPTAVAPQGAVANVAALPRGVRIEFETRDKGWSGGGLSFDNFSTPGVETGNLSLFSQVTFGLKGTVSKVKLEVIDSAGNKSTVNLAGILSGQEKVWVLPLTLLPEVDLTKIRLIYFIIEGNNQTGNLEITTKPA